MRRETRLEFDYSLHDAWIEHVAVGPRREIRLALVLGSARITDPRLPEAAILRFGAIENFETVRKFFSQFDPDPIERIDGLTVLQHLGSSFTVAINIDPHGMINVVCSKLELTPIAA